MTILNTIERYVDALSNTIGLTDKDKAVRIKDFILNMENVSDGSKKNCLVNIKKYVIKNNIFEDNEMVNFINCKVFYAKCIDASNLSRETKSIIECDIEVVKEILKLKNNYKVDRNTKIHNINKYSLYIYLLFTSGLRTNEITDNSFTIIDNTTIRAKRISKQKEDDTDKPKDIKLLITSTEWLKLFENLQEQIKRMNITASGTIGSGIKRQIELIHPTMTAHSLRKLYLQYHKTIRKTDEDLLPSVLTKKLLHHSNENVSVFYNDAVKITGDLTELIDNTDYSKYKIAELKVALKNKNIPYKYYFTKKELLELLK